MDKQAFLDRITAIGTCEDDVQRRELLAALSEESEKVFEAYATATEASTNLAADNEKLRAANMKLFLRVGEAKDQGEVEKGRTGLEQPKEKLKFEDLFDEKGGLK